MFEFTKKGQHCSVSMKNVVLIIRNKKYKKAVAGSVKYPKEDVAPLLE